MMNLIFWIKEHPILAYMIFAVVLTLLLVGLSSGGSSSKGSGCTICGKKATHSFQGSGYCDRHYNDAVKWAIDNVAEKNKQKGRSVVYSSNNSGGGGAGLLTIVLGVFIALILFSVIGQFANVKLNDTVLLCVSMLLYLLNRFFLKQLEIDGLLYEIVQWHLNDYLGEIVFLCYVNILMRRCGYKRIIRLPSILFMVLLTCIMWEYIIPFFVKYSTPDIKDCFAYLLGGLTYWIIQQVEPTQ